LPPSIHASNRPRSSLERACSSRGARSGNRHGQVSRGCVKRRAMQSPHDMGVSSCVRPDDRATPTAPLPNQPRQYEPIAQPCGVPAADHPAERENAAPAREVLRQAEGGTSAEAPYGVPVNIRLERMGGIFDHRIPNRLHVALSSTTRSGRPVVVTCQIGGNGRPLCVIDFGDSHVSIVGTPAPSPARAQPQGRRRTTVSSSSGT